MQHLQRVISYWLPDEKIMILSRVGDGLPILRRAGSQKQRDVKYRNTRPYMLAEVAEFIPHVQVNVNTEHVN
jgi:pre-rRNA-processing protein TSR1